ncbi:hypothetical protein J3R82DRAFT_9259 [Butyriboletus roseoflavus]|nr:hypothetical protein J3R82DRAFT_9259 [Butyriboletus roseoflavus]
MSSLIRFHYDPFAEFNCLFDDAFHARFSPVTSSAQVAQRPEAQSLDSFRPKLDLHESKDSNTVTATFELPGLNSEDITIDLHHNRLMVSGESTTSNSRRVPMRFVSVIMEGSPARCSSPLEPSVSPFSSRHRAGRKPMFCQKHKCNSTLFLIASTVYEWTVTMPTGRTGVVGSANNLSNVEYGQDAMERI